MRSRLERSGLAAIADKVLAGERLSAADGLTLYQTPDLNAVGWLANIVRERMHGNRAFYVRNLHINYTNICDKFCRFCGFYARKDGPAPYVLDTDQVRERIRQYREIPLTEIHIVGGIHPKLPYSYYLDLLRAVRDERPGAHIKAFTMIELQQIQAVAGKPLEEVLAELKDAGLASCPGGGVEILSDRLHEALFGRKLDGQAWLDTARVAHQAGLRTNATMLYGHLERPEERIEHMVRLRELQDETGGFLTFNPLSFHPERTDLESLPGPTGCDDLRTLAISRLMLDNFPHLKAFWVMCTAPVAQSALWYGVDDVDGTVLRYEVTRDSHTDSSQQLTQEQLVGLIREAGREPVERDVLYRPVGGEPDTASGPAPRHPALPTIADKVERGERLSFQDGVALLEHHHLPELGALANLVRERKNPERAVTYTLGRTINYTNVCWVGCKFCTFCRKPDAADAYLLPREEIHNKISELVAAGGAEVLLQGGLNPRLGIEWYEDLFREMKERHPIHLHALSPTEILHIAHVSRLDVETTLERLRAAGLDSLPGGGAEMLVDEVKARIAPRKHHPEEWLGVMRAAHRLGIPTTATMVYGFGESMAQRVEHLLKLRDLQDETGGFTAFIAWNFQPDGTELGGTRASGYDYLRTIAAARLLLDNFPHIQASWLTQGPKIGQIALHYGVDDFGSTVLEENVITAAGARFLIPVTELERIIRDAGYEPRRRNTRYQLL